VHERTALDLTRAYIWLATLAAVAMLYGSLVPLDFQRMPWDTAVARLRQWHLSGFRFSSDGVANVLLSMPLAFCAVAAIRRRWPTSRGLVWSIAFAGVVLPLYSVAIEFLQIYVGGRTSSLDDVAAQAVGGFAGGTMRLLFADPADEWLRVIAVRSRGSRAARLLALYLPILCLIDFLPLDITISPGDLWRKYTLGRIVLVPFSSHYDSALAAVWDVAGAVLKSAPIGALLMLDRRPSTRTVLRALVIGTGIVAGIELGQLFIWSRYADATDVVVGFAGVAAGVLLASSALPRRFTSDAPEGGINWTAMAAAVGWLVVLAGFEWYPFHVIHDRTMIRSHLIGFLEVPFAGFYWSNPLSALEDALTKLLVAGPLGIFTALAVGRALGDAATWRRTIVVVAAFFGLFCVMELGQAFTSDRYSSITDAMLLTVAATAGLVVASTTGAGVPREAGTADSLHLGQKSLPVDEQKSARTAERRYGC
jgi:VanZ family protein